MGHTVQWFTNQALILSSVHTRGARTRSFSPRSPSAFKCVKSGSVVTQGVLKPCARKKIKIHRKVSKSSCNVALRATEIQISLYVSIYIHIDLYVMFPNIQISLYVSMFDMDMDTYCQCPS